ncbi:MAG: hypothetical protein ACLP50_29325 [Solirubrobacteraceae bacterium]|jgi:hypothetical protein
MATADAARALARCGIAWHVAYKLAAKHTPDLIGAWASYAERNPSMGPGAVVVNVRSGHYPPARRSRRRDLSRYDASTQ